MTAKPAPAKKQLFERALRELRACIMSGDLRPGQHLSEPAAAELIGISRTPTREAMARLVEEGLLIRSPTGRCTVCEVTREDIVDALELRGVVEGTVLRIAAERGGAASDLARCEAIVEEIDVALGDTEADICFERYAELNEAFHETIAGVSGSNVLERELRRVFRLPLASPNSFLQNQTNVPFIRKSLFVAQSQHKAMIAAIRAREGNRAESIAREHARLARQNLDFVLRERNNNTQQFPGLSLVRVVTANT